jgi:hypothetical protein
MVFFVAAVVLRVVLVKQAEIVLHLLVELQHHQFTAAVEQVI